jgi:hypothetical protein
VVTGRSTYRLDADRRLGAGPKEQFAIDRIKELRRTGLSMREIARTVHRDGGVTVSAMTVRLPSPARSGPPGYWPSHDRDRDGIACEP